MRAMYEIHAGPMNFKYYMHHEVDEKQKCVTFHLDYDRCAAPEPQPAPEPKPCRSVTLTSGLSLSCRRGWPETELKPWAP
jgi:hypothetical protein